MQKSAFLFSKAFQPDPIIRRLQKLTKVFFFYGTDSKLDCFALFGDQTAAHFRERFQLGLTTQAVDAYLERLIVTSTGSNYTKLYDTFQYYRLVFFFLLFCSSSSQFGLKQSGG